MLPVEAIHTCRDLLHAPNLYGVPYSKNGLYIPVHILLYLYVVGT